MLLRAMQMSPATDRARGTRMPDGGPVELPEVEIFPDYPKDSPWTLKETLANVLTSNANFARRIRQAGRKSIPDWEVEGAIATHKLGAEIGEDGKVYVYPWVQELDGNLYDFSDPRNGHGDRARWDALDSAIEHGDYIQFPDLETAIWFTERYKDDGLFPKFEDGGWSWRGIRNLLWNVTHPKDAAYTIMKRTDGIDFMPDMRYIISALQDTDERYMHGREGRHKSFDYPHMYIYGEAEGARELTDEEKSRGVDYTSYLKKVGRDPSTIKQYQGKLGTDIYLPESMKSELDKIVGTGKNPTIGFSGYSSGDGVGGFLGRINKDSSGDYVVDYSDLWDFEPQSYSHRWGVGEDFIGERIDYAKAWLLDRVGTPFVVRDRGKVIFLPDDEYESTMKDLDKSFWTGEKGPESAVKSDMHINSLDAITELNNAKSRNYEKKSSGELPPKEFNIGDAFRMIMTPYREELDRRADGGEVDEDVIEGLENDYGIDRETIAEGLRNVDWQQLYREDVERVMNGERARWFGELNDRPLENVSPEFGIIGAALGVMNALRAASKPFINLSKELTTKQIRRNMFLEALKEWIVGEGVEEALTSGVDDTQYADGGSTMEEGGDTSSKSIKEKAGNLLRSIANPRDAAYKIMSNSGGEASLGIGDVLDIILNDGSVGNYTGGTDTGAGSFDFPRMYIYGEAEGAKELPESERRFGADYDDYLRSIGRDPSTVKQYEGDLGTEIFLPESYRAVIDELVDTDKNENIGFDLDYFSEGHDDVAGYLGRVGKDDDGNYVMGYSDLWDFHPEDYSKTWGETGGDFLTYAESWLLNKVGSPFIVRSKKNIRFYPDDEYFRILDDLKGSDGERGVIGENSDMVYRALTRMSGRGFGDYEPIMRNLSAPGVVKMLTALPIRDTQHTGVRTRKSGGPITEAYEEYMKTHKDDKKKRASRGVMDAGTAIVPNLPKKLLWELAYGEGGKGIFGNPELIKMAGGGDTSKIEDHAWDMLTNYYNIPPVQAVGIMANLKAESDFNLRALGDNGKSYGLNQWQGERRKALFDFALKRAHGKPDADDQLAFLVHEWETGSGFPGAGGNPYVSGATGNPTFDYYQYSKKDFDSATNVLDSTRAWAQGFGRGNKEAFDMDKRFAYARRYAEKYGVEPGGEAQYGMMGYTDGLGTSGDAVAGTTTVTQQKPAEKTPDEQAAIEDYIEKFGRSLASGIVKGMREDREREGAEAKAAAEAEAEEEKKKVAQAQDEARSRFIASMISGIRLDIKGNRRAGDDS